MKRFLAFLLITLAPATVRGQTAPDSIPQILQRIDSGSVLRVRAGRMTTRGRFSGMSDDAIVLEQVSGSQTPIRFTAINDIWKQGTYWKQGAIIGAVTGTAVLTGFGWVLVRVSCEQPDGCRNDYRTVVLYSILLGGGGGGLVGAGLGYVAKRWIPIFSN
jgi:hypothetical protein